MASKSLEERFWSKVAARQFGVSENTVKLIRKNRLWREAA